MLFRVEAAVMQGLAKPTYTGQKTSWNVPKGIKTTFGGGPVSEDTFKRHYYRKKKNKILNNLKLKKKFLNYKIYYLLLESNLLDTNKTRNELFEGMKKACPL